MKPAQATRLACGQGQIVRRSKNSVFQLDLRIAQGLYAPKRLEYNAKYEITSR